MTSKELKISNPSSIRPSENKRWRMERRTIPLASDIPPYLFRTKFWRRDRWIVVERKGIGGTKKGTEEIFLEVGGIFAKYTRPFPLVKKVQRSHKIKDIHDTWQEVAPQNLICCS
jgi:hypothetical protein